MLKIMFRILTLSSVTIGYSFASPKHGYVPIRWSGGAIDWPSELTKNMYTKEKKYINKNIIAIRFAMYCNEAIVALPRFKPGIPITLAKFPLKCKAGRATLSPFPSWDQQEEGDCDALQSVVDLFHDLRNTLWVLDTGIVNSMEEPVRMCSPKVVGYNMKTGKIVKSVDLSSVTNFHSRLQYVIADYSPEGQIFLYITDAGVGAIIVYNVTSNHGYRILLPTTCGTEHDVLYPILLRHSDGTSYLLFSYLSDKRLYSIRGSCLQNGTVQGHIYDVGGKPRNIIFIGTDTGTAVFFRFEGEADIYRWDATTSLCEENFDMVYSRNDNLELATQVVPDFNAKRMRVLQSNFPDYIQGNVGCGIDHSLTII